MNITNPQQNIGKNSKLQLLEFKGIQFNFYVTNCSKYRAIKFLDSSRFVGEGKTYTKNGQEVQLKKTAFFFSKK